MHDMTVGNWQLLKRPHHRQFKAQAKPVLCLMMRLTRDIENRWNRVTVNIPWSTVTAFNFNFLVTSISETINTTHESIAFECSKYDSSMKYYGHVYEKDRPRPFSRIKCEKNGCQCMAIKLKPNTAYLVSLEACPNSQCKIGKHTMTVYTKPEGKSIICGF